MANKSNDISVKLLAGQQKLERDVDALKTDMDVLKTDVGALKTDMAVMKTDMVVMKTDMVVMKTDMSVMKTDMADLKEGQNRVEKFLLNLENIIMPKINAMYENSISNRQQIKELEEVETKNVRKLENH